MGKVHNTSLAAINQWENKWDTLSFNSSGQMGKHYLNYEMVPESPNSAQPERKTRTKKKTGGNKVSLPPSTFFNETLFFENHMCGIENRTVNSLADIRDQDDSDTEKVKRRKLKPKYLDSEVDLMMTSAEDHRPRIKYSDIAPKHPENRNKNLIPIKTLQPAAVVVETGNKKKISKPKILSKGTNVTADSSDLCPKKGKNKHSTDPNAHFSKFPILKNEELVKKFLQVEMTNNQKGRIRQVMRQILKGSTPAELPNVINNKIQAILSSSEDLTNSDLRKIRILYNMLKKAIIDVSCEGPIKQPKEKKKEAAENKEAGQNETPKKAKKRYVVFVGNLPLSVTKEQLYKLFNDVRLDIKDIRFPEVPGEVKCAIAYVEFKNRHSYEIALSKNHCMVGNKRINVMYTAQKKTKLSSSEIKTRQAKLLALQKTGKLIGSIPLNKKRSQRRLKQRKALASAEMQKEPSSKLIGIVNYSME